MLNTDDIVKLLLAAAFTFAIVVVSWQVARLLAEITANLKEIKFITRMLQDLSEEALGDYRKVKGFVANMANLSKLPAIFMGLNGILSKWQNKKKKSEKSENLSEPE